MGDLKRPSELEEKRLPDRKATKMSCSWFSLIGRFCVLAFVISSCADAANYGRVDGYKRNLRTPARYAYEDAALSQPDPTLAAMSTDELYRLLALLDLMESKKVEKLSPRDLDTFNMLLETSPKDYLQ